MVSLVRRTERNHSIRNVLSCFLHRDTAPQDPNRWEVCRTTCFTLRAVMHKGKKEIVSTALHSLVRWKNCAPGISACVQINVTPACEIDTSQVRASHRMGATAPRRITTRVFDDLPFKRRLWRDMSPGTALICSYLIAVRKTLPCTRS
jgi:N-acyl-L-homoserine lactone synthetase